MPNRFIRESCRSSRNLDRLTDFEERLFWRLLTTADDYGRFMADPELVRAACFPYKSLSVEKVGSALEGLQSHSLISLYAVDNRQYGEFVTFEKHQGKPRSRKSKYPERLDVFLHADVSNSLQMKPVLVSGETPPNTNTDLNSSSLNSILDSPQENDVSDLRFEEFWQAYPARNGKKLEKAATAALFLKLDPADQALAVQSARNYADALKHQGISPKDPKRWLRDGQGHEPWRDWMTPAISDPGGKNPVQTCQSRIQQGMQLKPCGEMAVGLIGKRPVCQAHKEEHEQQQRVEASAERSTDGRSGAGCDLARAVI